MLSSQDHVPRHVTWHMMCHLTSTLLDLYCDLSSGCQDMGPILFGQWDIGARCCFHWRSAFCSPSISYLINILSGMSSLSSRQAWSIKYKTGCLSLRFGNRKLEDQIQKFKVGCVLSFDTMFSEIDKLSFPISSLVL